MGIKKLSIQDIFFSKVQQRVLGILYGQPAKFFYTNEIIRLSQIGTGAVQRELLKLSSVGIISVKLVGNQKHYQANQANPFFSELHSIVLKTFGLADVLNDALSSVSSEILITFIYGSVAKREDSAESDIDLMVISEKLTYSELFPLLEKAESKLGRRVNPTCYSTLEWVRKKNQNNNFLNQILKQEKIFLIGTENELEQLR